jgi:hypothetical protein
MHTHASDKQNAATSTPPTMIESRSLFGVSVPSGNVVLSVYSFSSPSNQYDISGHLRCCHQYEHGNDGVDCTCLLVGDARSCVQSRQSFMSLETNWRW